MAAKRRVVNQLMVKRIGSRRPAAVVCADSDADSDAGLAGDVIAF